MTLWVLHSTMAMAAAANSDSVSLSILTSRLPVGVMLVFILATKVTSFGQMPSLVFVPTDDLVSSISASRSVASFS